MKNKSAKIGHWATICCCEDAFKIETQEELDEILSEDEISYVIEPTEQEIKQNNCSCGTEICKNLTQLKL